MSWLDCDHVIYSPGELFSEEITARQLERIGTFLTN